MVRIMARQVLWLDNECSYLSPYREVLEEESCEVTFATTVSEAESLVQTRRYDLLILDVMIPTKNVVEETLYPPDQTDRGLRTGLVFYRRMKDRLDGLATEVLVLTVRLDQDILSEFLAAGLPRGCFATKFQLRHLEVFRQRVKTILGEST